MKDIFPLNALLAIITKYGVTIFDEVRKSMLKPCHKIKPVLQGSTVTVFVEVF